MCQLTVYIRRGCHLCSDMMQALERLHHELGFSYTAVDIDNDPDLHRRYDRRVPVLAGADREICEYFLDEQRLRGYCAGLPGRL